MDSGPLARVQVPCGKGLSVSNLSAVSQRSLEHVRGSEGILANHVDLCGLSLSLSLSFLALCLNQSGGQCCDTVQSRLGVLCFKS